MLASAKSIGTKLVALCQQEKHMEAVNTLYDKAIVSVEAAAMPGQERTLKGIDAIRGKSEWWFANHKIHSSSAEGPFPHGEDRFAVIFDLDVTPTAGPMANQRMKMREIGVYTVKNGKVIREEFYYATG